MLIKDVKKLSIQERFVYFIKERESIRLKKEAGEPWPWTDDEILQKYRFCNVRRMDDKVSQWLLKNWYIPNFNHPNMLVACTLARQLNNTESLGSVGFPFVWEPQKVEQILNKRAKQGLKNFSAAYMITGTLGGTKIQQVINKVVTPIAKILDSLNFGTSLEELWKQLLPCAGVSTFIAGQIVCDLRWAWDGTWNDRKVWAPIGPGSRRGMNRILGREIKTPMKQAEFLNSLEALIRVSSYDLPRSILSRLEAIDWQNCCCEFDKYTRTLLGEGNPKQLYRRFA